MIVTAVRFIPEARVHRVPYMCRIALWRHSSPLIASHPRTVPSVFGSWCMIAYYSSYFLVFVAAVDDVSASTVRFGIQSSSICRTCSGCLTLFSWCYTLSLRWSIAIKRDLIVTLFASVIVVRIISCRNDSYIQCTILHQYTCRPV